MVTSRQVSGLTKGAAYHVRVSAFNGVALSYGNSMYSTPPLVYPSAGPEPPSRLEVEAFSPSSLAISWSRPNSDMGMDVVGYQVVSREGRVSLPELSSTLRSKVN